MEDHMSGPGDSLISPSQRKQSLDSHIEPHPSISHTNNHFERPSEPESQYLSPQSQPNPSPWFRKPDPAEPPLSSLERQTFMSRQDTELGGHSVNPKLQRPFCCSRSTILILVLFFVVVIAAVVAGGVVGSQPWKR